MKPRQNVNIELLEGLKDELEKIRQRNGMTQKELVGRVLTWFCQQDQLVQLVVLGQIPEELAPDVAQLILRQIAHRVQSGSDKATEASVIGEVGDKA